MKEKEFYTVGSLIQYTMLRRSVNGGLFVKTSYRLMIDDLEIESSFHENTGCRFLFEYEENAFAYSLFLKKEKNSNWFQPAVFKVFYRGDKDFSIFSDKISFFIKEKEYSMWCMKTKKDELKLLSGNFTVCISGQPSRCYQLTEESVKNLEDERFQLNAQKKKGLEKEKQDIQLSNQEEAISKETFAVKEEKIQQTETRPSEKDSEKDNGELKEQSFQCSLL